MKWINIDYIEKPFEFETVLVSDGINWEAAWYRDKEFYPMGGNSIFSEDARVNVATHWARVALPDGK